ncbi:hypothetical protein CL634_10800 [bacterium]|nr:hypothetical protein [bacterium]|tara:strand:- start:116 stop:538 length:423 start_codon:yes stop_codon:yes gene_type:complete
MKRAELKKVLKPLIKECIKEVIFEEGVLSGIITEVAAGLKSSYTQPIVERQVVATREVENVARRELEQVRKQVLEEINKDSYNGVNLFEGTEPISQGGTEGDNLAPNSPLAGTNPKDPGVDISGIVSLGRGANWNKLVNG